MTWRNTGTFLYDARRIERSPLTSIYAIIPKLFFYAVSGRVRFHGVREEKSDKITPLIMKEPC